MSRWLFRHLKYQNMSTGDDFIHRNGIIFVFSYLATKEAVAPLEMILLCWEDQYGRLDTLNI